MGEEVGEEVRREGRAFERRAEGRARAVGRIMVGVGVARVRVKVGRRAAVLVMVGWASSERANEERGNRIFLTVLWQRVWCTKCSDVFVVRKMLVGRLAVLKLWQ